MVRQRPFTDTSIRSLKAAPGERIEVWDAGCPGLGVRVSGPRKGSASTACRVKWVLNARDPSTGRSRRVVLGEYPHVTLSEARLEANRLKSQHRAGLDPRAVLEAERAKAAAALEAIRQAPTVADLLDEYEKAEAAYLKSGPERMRSLRKDLKPWAERKVGDIRRRDATLLLEKVYKRGQVARNRFAAYLGRLWQYALEAGIIEANPLTRLTTKRGAAGKKLAETPRSRALSMEEVSAFWQAVDADDDMLPATRLALKLVLVTGQRPAEVAGAPWSEFDDDLTLWTLDGERRKDGEVHTVPVSPLAREILEQARALAPDSEFVFKSTHTRGDEDKPIRRDTLSQGLMRILPDIQVDGEPVARFVPHDLRRTCRTHLSRLGVDPLLAERVLGHSLKSVMGRIASTYDTHDPVAEKAAALGLWAAEIQRHLQGAGGAAAQPTSEDKVVRLHVAS